MHDEHLVLPIWIWHCLDFNHNIVVRLLEGVFACAGGTATLIVRFIALLFVRVCVFVFVVVLLCEQQTAHIVIRVRRYGPNTRKHKHVQQHRHSSS
jgi:hypothetical protein